MMLRTAHHIAEDSRHNWRIAAIWILTAMLLVFPWIGYGFVWLAGLGGTAQPLSLTNDQVRLLMETRYLLFRSEALWLGILALLFVEATMRPSDTYRAHGLLSAAVFLAFTGFISFTHLIRTLTTLLTSANPFSSSETKHVGLMALTVAAWAVLRVVYSIALVRLGQTTRLLAVLVPIYWITLTHEGALWKRHSPNGLSWATVLPLLVYLCALTSLVLSSPTDATRIVTASRHPDESESP